MRVIDVSLTLSCSANFVISSAATNGLLVVSATQVKRRKTAARKDLRYLGVVYWTSTGYVHTAKYEVRKPTPIFQLPYTFEYYSKSSCCCRSRSSGTTTSTGGILELLPERGGGEPLSGLKIEERPSRGYRARVTSKQDRL